MGIFFLGVLAASLSLYSLFEKENTFITQQLLAAQDQYHRFMEKWETSVSKEQKLNQKHTLALADLNAAKQEYATLYQEHLELRRTLQARNETLLDSEHYAQQQADLIHQLQSQIEAYELKEYALKERLNQSLLERLPQKQPEAETIAEPVIHTPQKHKEDPILKNTYKTLPLAASKQPQRLPELFRARIESVQKRSITVNFGTSSGAKVNMKCRLQQGLKFIDYATILKVDAYTSILRLSNESLLLKVGQDIVISPYRPLDTFTVTQSFSKY